MKDMVCMVLMLGIWWIDFGHCLLGIEESFGSIWQLHMDSVGFSHRREDIRPAGLQFARHLAWISQFSVLILRTMDGGNVEMP